MRVSARGLRGVRFAIAIGGIGLSIVRAPEAHAQATGSISGTVTDSAGVPVFGADVAVEGTTSRTLTDAQGEFHLVRVPRDRVVVRARRLGFVPRSVEVQVADAGSASVTLRLSALAATLAPIVVRPERLQYTGRLGGYYERLERRNTGYFITREQIESENPRMMSHLLQRVPGLSLVRGRAGLTGVRMRGRTCWPMVWLDDTPMPAGEVDLDSFAPQSLEGIELYLGGTSPPMRYNWIRNMSSCGTILLWTRAAERRRSPERAGASPELESLVASNTVLTADQVDTVARLAGSGPLVVQYPQSLFAEGVGGLVVAEYVVRADGRVDAATFGIVSTTHPLFSQAVRDAVEGAMYVPAIRRGEFVRQLVHQPFTFVAPEPRDRSPRRAAADARPPELRR